MSDRKQTPDVLADILGAGIDSSQPAPASRGRVRPTAHHRSAPARAPAPAEPADKLQRWEYMLVSCQEYRGWRPRYEDGVELAGWTRGPLLLDYLVERGRDGWELVAASSGRPMFGVTYYYQLFLKRPMA